jgi:putative OPT family oligopeptide transporter
MPPTVDRSPKTGRLVPYVAAGAPIAEFTIRAVVLGTVLSVAFGMVNAYLGLKVGLTVSASIPSAVLSMGVLRGILRRGTILENNVVQTIASTGESLAAGVVFTIPALLFIGADPSGFRIFLIAATAGLLGILMMIPLRHDLTVAEHGRLPFPEGTACATVLIAGDRGRTAARPVFLGLGIGGAYQFAMRGLHLWRETLFVSFAGLHKLSLGAELTPLFLGVGYLIGARIAAVMLSGGLLAWAILIPLFDMSAGTGFGHWLGLPSSVHAMDAREIWSAYVRFVGAGAVACGGALSIARTLPVMLQSFRRSMGGLWRRRATARQRTEVDLSPRLVVAGTLALVVALWVVPVFEMSFLEALLAVVFTYFFVVVSARMVGLIGSTSQPVSGMTITALLGTAFTLHAFGYAGRPGMAATLSVAAVVCVAIAVAGDISQDLKCGALVGATPRALQVGEMVGAAFAALRAGWVLFLLHQAYTIGSEMLPAPQAKLMATLAQGVMQGNLPWNLLWLGVGLAAAAEAVGLSSLPFAIGLYLPITTTASLIAGGLIARWNSGRRSDGEDPATLLASGLIAGDALVGIAIAALVVSGWDRVLALRSTTAGPWTEGILTVSPYVLLAVFLHRLARRETSVERS